MALELSHDAEQILCEFADNVGRKIDELGFEMDARRKTEILLNIEIHFRLHAIKFAKKRRANIVKAVDARNALKRVNPTMAVKHALVGPQTFSHIQDQKARYFNLFKKKLEPFKQSALLDAGCGWGRQLIEYRKYRLKTEFVAFDVDKDAVRLGKKIDPSIDFLVADIQRIPFKSDSFDVVICNAVINFVNRQGAQIAIREFKRVLKSSGLLYLYALFTRNRLLTSALNLWSNVLRKVSREGGTFGFYTLTQIYELLSENKFTEIRTEKGHLTIIPCPFGSSEIITATMHR